MNHIIASTLSRTYRQVKDFEVRDCLPLRSKKTAAPLTEVTLVIEFLPCEHERLKVRLDKDNVLLAK
jgi:hypothetical protein